MNVNEWIVNTFTATDCFFLVSELKAAFSRLFGPPGVRWRRPLLLFFFFFCLSLPPTPPDITPPPTATLVCMPPTLAATAPVSCQVSSLLALSVSQRSDKSEPGVGLSLPLATEVSFSPSIIHILFNLTGGSGLAASAHPAKQTRAGFSQHCGGVGWGWGVGGCSVNYKFDLRVAMNGTTRVACGTLMTLWGDGGGRGGVFSPPYESTLLQQTCGSCIVFFRAWKEKMLITATLIALIQEDLLFYFVCYCVPSLSLHTFFFLIWNAESLGGLGGGGVNLKGVPPCLH